MRFTTAASRITERVDLGREDVPVVEAKRPSDGRERQAYASLAEFWLGCLPLAGDNLEARALIMGNVAQCLENAGEHALARQILHDKVLRTGK